jgi:hypothetical protein
MRIAIADKNLVARRTISPSDGYFSIGAYRMKRIARKNISFSAASYEYRQKLMDRYGLDATAVITEIALDVCYRMQYVSMSMIVYIAAEQLYLTLEGKK